MPKIVAELMVLEILLLETRGGFGGGRGAREMTSA